MALMRARLRLFSPNSPRPTKSSAALEELVAIVVLGGDAETAAHFDRLVAVGVRDAIDQQQRRAWRTSARTFGSLP